MVGYYNEYGIYKYSKSDTLNIEMLRVMYTFTSSAKHVQAFSNYWDPRTVMKFGSWWKIRRCRHKSVQAFDAFIFARLG